MDFNTFQNVVRAGTPFDKGNMMENGWKYFDTPYKYVAIADTFTVPYIVYNEEGTIYTQKNKNFIREGIMGQLMHISQSETLGLPYSYKETNKTLAQRRLSLMENAGVIGRSK